MTATRFTPTTVVIDPGVFGFPESVGSADAALVTHDHFDYVDLPAPTAAMAEQPELRVYSLTPLDLGAFSDRQTRVDGGEDEFTVGDLEVVVVGHEQARASVDDGVIVNVGYFVAGQVLHPGDGVDTLVVALAAPWQNTPQLEQYLRKVKPRKVLALHDDMLNSIGVEFGNKQVERIAKSYGGQAIALAPGESVVIGGPEGSTTTP